MDCRGAVYFKNRIFTSFFVPCVPVPQISCSSDAHNSPKPSFAIFFVVLRTIWLRNTSSAPSLSLRSRSQKQVNWSLHSNICCVTQKWTIRRSSLSAIARSETVRRSWDSTTRQRVSSRLAMGMGIDLEAGGMPHWREFARISTAWKKAKAQMEVKTSKEALQLQHGERTTMLPEDWTCVIVLFKKKYGTDLQDEELPSLYYYEDFQERLSAGMLRAEPLDQVISLAEAELQDSQRPDPPRQYGFHLDA